MVLDGRLASVTQNVKLGLNRLPHHRVAQLVGGQHIRRRPPHPRPPPPSRVLVQDLDAL